MEFSMKITNLKSFQRAMIEGESIAAQGLWHGTRRSLGAMRREFLKTTPVALGGRNRKSNPRTDPGGPIRTLGSTFRWVVEPKNPVKRRSWSSEHVKSIRTVKGYFQTASKAAESLEEGSTITSKGPWIGIPVALEGNPNTGKRKPGQRTPRAKPSWRRTSDILKQRGYDFKFSARPGHTLLYAKKKRPKNSRPFLVMLLVRRVHMKRGSLNFYKFGRKFEPQVLRRFDEELRKIVRKVARNANKRA
jgi:hypothetical protein